MPTTITPASPRNGDPLLVAIPCRDCKGTGHQHPHTVRAPSCPECRGLGSIPRHLTSLSYEQLSDLRSAIAAELRARANTAWPCPSCNATDPASAGDLCHGISGCTLDTHKTLHALANSIPAQ